MGMPENINIKTLMIDIITVIIRKLMMEHFLIIMIMVMIMLSRNGNVKSSAHRRSHRGVARIFQRGGGVTLCQTLSSWRFRDGIL